MNIGLISPQEVIVSNGAKQVLYNVLSILLNEGDEVAVPVPYWVTYPAQVAALRGKVIEVGGCFLLVSVDGKPVNALGVQHKQQNIGTGSQNISPLAVPGRHAGCRSQAGSRSHETTG